MEFTEADMFTPLQNWLEKTGWEVFGEVTAKVGTSRADIVAKHTGHITVIEMKKTLSLKVIEQAINWLGYANYVYIAIPARKQAIQPFILKLLKDYKIGLIEINMERFRYHVEYDEDFSNHESQIFSENNWKKMSTDTPGVVVNTSYYLKAKTSYWDTLLYPEMKDVVGGVSDGSYITPYKLTMNAIENYLAGQYVIDIGVGIEPVMAGYRTVANIVTNVETHYRQPKTSIPQAIAQFESERFDRIKRNGKLMFKATNAANNLLTQKYYFKIYSDNMDRFIISTTLPIELIKFDGKFLEPTDIPSYYYLDTIPTIVEMSIKDNVFQQVNFENSIVKVDLSCNINDLAFSYPAIKANGTRDTFTLNDLRYFGKKFNKVFEPTQISKLHITDIVNGILDSLNCTSYTPSIGSELFKAMQLKRPYKKFESVESLKDWLELVESEIRESLETSTRLDS